MIKKGKPGVLGYSTVSYPYDSSKPAADNVLMQTKKKILRQICQTGNVVKPCMNNIILLYQTSRTVHRA